MRSIVLMVVTSVVLALGASPAAAISVTWGGDIDARLLLRQAARPRAALLAAVAGALRGADSRR